MHKTVNFIRWVYFKEVILCNDKKVSYLQLIYFSSALIFYGNFSGDKSDRPFRPKKPIWIGHLAIIESRKWDGFMWLHHCLRWPLVQTYRLHNMLCYERFGHHWSQLGPKLYKVGQFHWVWLVPSRHVCRIHCITVDFFYCHYPQCINSLAPGKS